jgi:hypothetical protein
MQNNTKYGKLLSRKAMKEVKGGGPVPPGGGFTLWDCSYGFLLCHNSNPVYDGCSGFSNFCINTRKPCNIPVNQCI